MTPCAMAIGRMREAIVARRRAHSWSHQGPLAACKRCRDWLLVWTCRNAATRADARAILRVGVTGLEPGARGWELVPRARARRAHVTAHEPPGKCLNRRAADPADARRGNKRGAGPK
jgi:hypothetical protein